MELEVGDIVLCTVEKIERTNVFVEIENGQKGSITFSEVSPGRIRNIRDFVVPKKTIVCKILRISQNGHIDLSLRRVTQKEEKEAKERIKQEKSAKSILKTILKEKAEEIIKKISQKTSLHEFLQEAKEDPKGLEKMVGKTASKKIVDILKAQKVKEVSVKKTFSLSTKDPEGIIKIKELLGKQTEVEIRYLSAGKYSAKANASNPKEADKKIQERLKTITEKAKKQKIDVKEISVDK